MKPLTELQSYSADHQAILARAAEIGGFTEPVAVDFDIYRWVLLKNARKARPVPVDGMVVRDWSSYSRKYSTGIHFGLVKCTIESVCFVASEFLLWGDLNRAGLTFAVVDAKDYTRLYRIALRLAGQEVENVEAPVLATGMLEKLERNTLGYLDRDNLRHIRQLGGRPKRGLLLNGPPGNGKTSACRWLWAECEKRNLEYKTISADAYAEARRSCGAEAQVRELFALTGRGIVVFDDFDMALRDRDSSPDSDNQSVFLNALDGVRPADGVVYVFTTNCPLERIDRAFRRPGRIDAVLTFDKPDAAMRHRLISRWHNDIQRNIDTELAIQNTDGMSFADLEEIKNLLILFFLEDGNWSWARALAEFRDNRREFAQRTMGLGVPGLNGPG